MLATVLCKIERNVKAGSGASQPWRALVDECGARLWHVQPADGGVGAVADVAIIVYRVAAERRRHADRAALLEAARARLSSAS